MTTTKNQTKKLVFSALMLATALLLPFLTGQIPQVGSMLAPMHIPVLLCGLVCGAPYGLAVGLIAPGLRFLMFSMPPIFPVGLAMTFELAAYGLAAGLLYRALPKKASSLYISLIGAMLAGRCVWGIAMTVIAAVSAVPFNLTIFLSGAFATALPGIVLHLVLIPPVALALQKAGFVID